MSHLQEILALYVYTRSDQKEAARTRKTLTELFCHEYECLRHYNIPDTSFSIGVSNKLPSSGLAQIVHLDQGLMFKAHWWTDLKHKEQ